MPCVIEMFCRVPVGGVVTATDVAALHTEAKMQPRAADSQTVFTAIGAWRDLVDLIQMCATSRHLILPSSVGSGSIVVRVKPFAGEPVAAAAIILEVDHLVRVYCLSRV